MKIGKKICLGILLSGSLLMLSGCGRELVRTEKIEDIGTVKDINYNSSYTTMMPICTGKSVTLVPQTHPEDYDTIVEYKGVQYNLGSPELYKYVKDNNKINKNVKCSIETEYYDDGTSRTQIVKVEGIDG